MISLGGMCRFYSIFGTSAWVEPQKLTLLMRRGLTFDPLVLIALIRGFRYSIPMSMCKLGGTPYPLYNGMGTLCQQCTWGI